MLKSIIGTICLIFGFIDFIYLIITLFQFYQNKIPDNIGGIKLFILLSLLAIFLIAVVWCIVSDDDDLGSIK